MDYIILHEDQVEQLAQRVRAHILMGWEPQGGMSVVSVGSVLSFYQAMTKKR